MPLPGSGTQAYDVALSVSVTREELGLPDLELNDHRTYVVAPGSFGGQASWDRQQVSSRQVDGDITTSRRRRTVTENLVLEVYATSGKGLVTAMAQVVEAMNQAYFQLTVVIQGDARVWACEAADHTEKWEGPRWVALQGQLSFQVPRQPVPVLGGL